ncbi:MAG: hypothetical protein JW882_20380 [Deltaproteobacteria bacterium]|nr:hypothetical protein [Deltaproteobacteria bacterium]
MKNYPIIILSKMNALYIAYNLLAYGLFIIGLPLFLVYIRFKRNDDYGIRERMGCLTPETLGNLSGKPRIWIHAASLGEVRVAQPLIKELRRIVPGCSFMISTTTRHGRDLANELFNYGIPVFYAPVDLKTAVRNSIRKTRPDIIVFLETEIWPAWLTVAREMGVKTCLVNGRISERSIKRYGWFRPFFRFVLSNIDIFSMISDPDSIRIESMGADRRKIRVNGNAKYDLLSDMADPAIENEMREILDIHHSSPVLIAGSTRGGEEIYIIRAYKTILEKFPDIILIMAPRHINRVPMVSAMVKNAGFRCQLRSSLDFSKGRTENIIIMDTFGELFKLYSIGSIIFCGASLVPLGGQNPLEAAVWGKAVLYGPFMEDFLDAKALLEKNNAGITVTSPEMLAEEAIRLLSSPETLKEYGERARKSVMMRQRAAEKHAMVVAELLGHTEFQKNNKQR